MQRDDGLLAQHTFILSVIADHTFTGLDHRVAGEILKRYYPRHGNARASLRYLEQAVGADRKSIVTSRDRLVANGAFSIVREGAGTRPTEYLPHFDFKSSGGPTATTSGTDDSGGLGATSGGGVATTANDPSGGLETTESYLQDPAYNAGILVDSTVAAPLAADGPSAAAPRASDFDRLWHAYGRLGNKLKSRAAFEALYEPDVEHLVERAAAWAASARPDRQRMPLEKWLEQERYDEAERAPAERATRSGVAATAAGELSPVMRVIGVEELGSVFGDWRLRIRLQGDDAEQEIELHALIVGGHGPDSEAMGHLVDALGGDHKLWVGHRLRLRTAEGRIVGAESVSVDRQVIVSASDTIQRRDEMIIQCQLANEEGSDEGSLEIVLESGDYAAQEAGQSRFQQLLAAVGMDAIADSADCTAGRSS